MLGLTYVFTNGHKAQLVITTQHLLLETDPKNQIIIMAQFKFKKVRHQLVSRGVAYRMMKHLKRRRVQRDHTR